jgi:GT2 family glycosyltransferase
MRRVRIDKTPTRLKLHMLNSNPHVSVLMPVFNAAPFLVQSVASIIEQDYRDWELICVNDGSRDGSANILQQFAAIDSRIRVIEQSNSGIVAALQNAIAQSRGQLLARMDADDIAITSRFGKQVDYLAQHPDVVVVGGAALEIDVDGDPLRITRHPNDSSELVKRLLTRQSALIHPSVMMRRAAVLAAGGYRAQYQWIEDHDLWLRLSELGKLANLNDLVLGYRQHASSVCWQRSNTQRQLMNELLQEAYQHRQLACPPEVLLETVTVRSQGGPGKWARMALRGGQPRTARKHLLALWRSEASLAYKFRMTAELAARWPAAEWRSRKLDSPQRLPNLSAWEARILPQATALREAA